MTATVTATCVHCGADIEVAPPRCKVSEYSTTVECPACGASQRVTLRRGW